MREHRRGQQGHHNPNNNISPSKPKNTRQTLVRLWHYLSAHKLRLVVVFVMVTLTALLTLVGPYLIGIAIDNYILPRDFSGLFRLLLVMAGIYALTSLCAWLQSYLMINVAQRTVRNLRKDAFDKLEELPLSFFDSRPHGEVMSRLTNDIDLINNVLSMSLTQIFSSIITLVGTLALMLWLSPLLTVISLVTIPIMFIATAIITSHTRRYFSEQQKILGNLNGFIEENISGQKVIKAFVREKEEIKRFERTNTELKAVGVRAQIFSGIIGPLMNVLNNMGFAIVAAAGGWLAVQNVITIGTIAMFISYIRQFTRPLNELANQINMIQSAIAGAERLFEIMDEEPEPVDLADAIELKDAKGEVEFEDVYFSYKAGEPVLKGINFEVYPGENLALVGPTGAGKTTIINLLTRFYDIESGHIFVDGNEIRRIKRGSLRRSLGIVLQDTYLFSESVEYNIRYGRIDASLEEVKAAARLANAEQFILSLPAGYDTVLGEDASDLSQGQRQLLAIARAILANPSILILDEATSNVDTRTEKHIQEAMLKIMEGRTSFIIAHRLSTIRQADNILVINDGQIIERGNHEELLQQKGFYYNLYMSQFIGIEKDLSSV